MFRRTWLAVAAVLVGAAGVTAAPFSARVEVRPLASLLAFTMPLGTVPLDE